MKFKLDLIIIKAYIHAKNISRSEFNSKTHPSSHRHADIDTIMTENITIMFFKVGSNKKSCIGLMYTLEEIISTNQCLTVHRILQARYSRKYKINRLQKQNGDTRANVSIIVYILDGLNTSFKCTSRHDQVLYGMFISFSYVKEHIQINFTS